ncbi:MAG: histidine kinase [Gordonia sp. (in: high G+C Gram-positive bacteria)]
MHDPLALPGATRLSTAVDVLVALFVVGLSVLSVHPMHGYVELTVSLIVGAAVACRRTWPSAMMALALVSAAVQVATSEVAVVPCLAYALLFSVAGGHPVRAVRRGSLAVAVSGSMIAGLVLPKAFEGGLAYDDGIGRWLVGTALSAVVVVGGWTTGFIRYQRRTVETAKVSETISELERRRLVELYDEQAERSRLARDMHDVVAHSLAVVIAQAEGARYSLEKNPEAAREALGVIAETGREALGDVRAVLEELRSGEAPGAATRADREQLYTRMRAAGMRLEIHDTGDDAPSAVAGAAFRILTEALTNALKYGDLDEPVVVRHDWSADGCRMSVRNRIAERPLAPGGARHGILGMTERAAAVDGALRSIVDGPHWIIELVVPAPGRPPHRGDSA